MFTGRPGFIHMLQRDPPATADKPLWQAILSTSQVVTGASGFQKMQFTTELYDTHNLYDDTNAKMVPGILNYGYYLVSIGFYISGGVSTGPISVGIGLNGTIMKRGNQDLNDSYSCDVTGIIRVASFTDYIEAYLFSLNNITVSADSAQTYFDGVYLRGL